MYIKGGYYMTDQRTGEKIRATEATREAKTGYIVKRGTEDPIHPQENIRVPRILSQPTFVSPEPEDRFLDPNDVLASDF
jgi:hypothetical protein